MPSLADDIRFSLRSLLRSPGFATTAVVVLGLAIGLNAAVFSAVNALLVKPLGGPIPGELAGVYQRERGSDRYRRFTYREYDALRGAHGLVSSILAHDLTSVGVTDGESSRR